MIIYNATDELQKTRAYGKFFEWKPGQKKVMDDKFGHFILEKRSHLGLRDLPEEFTDPDFEKSAEGKRILEAKREEGVKAYCDWLQRRILNNTESLKKDLRTYGVDTDPRLLMSKGEEEALEKLAQYKKNNKKSELDKLEKIKKLEEQISKG